MDGGLTRATHRMCVSYEGLSVAVCSAEGSHLSWLEEALAPYFTPAPQDHCDIDVVLTNDSERYAAVLGKGPDQNGNRIVCFNLDTRDVRHPLWSAGSAELCVRDEDYNVFYFVRNNGSEIEILANAGCRWSRVALMRVVRELAMSHGQQSGALIIHGSSFAFENRGVLIAGPKRAGKTSLLIHSLRNRRTRYLANDRVLVSPSRHGARIVGMPTMVTIRPPTTDLFPHLRAALDARAYRQNMTLAEAELESVAPVLLEKSGRYCLSPGQFYDLLDLAPVREAELGAILFPRADSRGGSLELLPLSSQDAAARLTASVFRASFSTESGNVFSPACTEPPVASAIRDKCFELVSRIPCYAAPMGPGAYSDPTTVDRIIECAAR